jgi:hypothetical protein
VGRGWEEEGRKGALWDVLMRSGGTAAVVNFLFVCLIILLYS